ncbi:probable low affinity copper uptake protein 2 [Argonauta hians]
MYLVLTTKVSNLLFEGWNSKDFPGMIAMCFMSLGVAIFYEAARLLQTFVHIRARQNPILYGQDESENTPTDNSGSNSLQNLVSSLSTPSIKRKRNLYYVAETMMHMFLSFVGYLIMLIVMTFNVWLSLAVILGTGIGYFLFDNSILKLAKRSPNTPRYRDSISDNLPTVASNTEFVTRTSDLSI